MSIFITLEGTEGCGKTTQIPALARLLETQGYRVTCTREPGGCDIADAIRAILLDPLSHGMAARTELLLYAAARAQHIDDVIRPALDRGEVVLCDRFADATRAYQGAGRGLDPGLIETLNEIATQKLEPDLTLLFDLPVEVGLSRARQRQAASDGPAEDRFEQEALDFHHRIREGYLRLARENDQRIRIVDASGTIAQVAQRVESTVLGRLGIA